MRFIFILLLAVIFIVPQHVCAATIDDFAKTFRTTPRELDSWRGAKSRAGGEYAKMASALLAYPNNREAILTGLRAYYDSTPQYDPFSKDLLDQMTEYGYIIDTSEDMLEVNRALIEYRALLKEHISHLDVVIFAITLSRIDARYGDERFLKDVRDKIIASVKANYRTGLSPKRAYEIVTFAEQEYLLQEYGGEVQKRDMYQVVGKYYNVIDIVDENGDFQQLYFDITKPVRAVLMNRALNVRQAVDPVPQTIQ